MAEAQARTEADTTSTHAPSAPSTGPGTNPYHEQLRGMDFATGSALLSPIQRQASGGGIAHEPAPSGARVQLKPVQRDAKEKAQNLEARDGGHSLDRHGPEVSDQQLQDRLTTGIAPDNIVSPAPGLSTKFTSYGEYLATRTAAVSLVKTGMIATVAVVKPLLMAVVKAKKAFDAEPSGPEKGKKSAALGAAKTSLDTGCKGLGQSSMTHFPVKCVKGAAAPVDMVVLYGGYGVVVDHGRVIGSGFEGKDEKAVVHPRDRSKDDITVYDKTEAVAGGVSQTKSSFDVTGNTKLFAPHNPGAWKAGQHFPTKGDTPGISA